MFNSGMYKSVEKLMEHEITKSANFFFAFENFSVYNTDARFNMIVQKGKILGAREIVSLRIKP